MDESNTEAKVEGNHVTAACVTGTSQQVRAREEPVCSVRVRGVDIFALRMSGELRLCLAQLSSRLLSEFSYNEIHNRRVALGISCAQCTPLQLEQLRRAGAMPLTSRRCGMITQREADRLLRSFLDAPQPPRLARDFRFAVEHACGWGCRGSFVPSRYTSSRAKCVQCDDCKVFLSPNKFIFHSHASPTASYRHPDAANFTSWRRHLRLRDSRDAHLLHAWEDVKAVFNGGSKRRLQLSSSRRSQTSDRCACAPLTSQVVRPLPLRLNPVRPAPMWISRFSRPTFQLSGDLDPRRALLSASSVAGFGSQNFVRCETVASNLFRPYALP